MEKPEYEIIIKDKLENFTYPVDKIHSSQSQRKFLIDSLNMWHNGIHLKDKNVVKAAADGEIIVMKLTDKYLSSYCYDSFSIDERSKMNVTEDFENYFEEKKGKFILKRTLTDEQKEIAYYYANELFSNSFILMKHSFKNIAQKDIVFYTLYNHLKPVNQLTINQIIKLPYFNVSIKILQNQTNYLIEGYQNLNNTGLIQIPSKTKIDFSEYRKITWTENGKEYTGYIKEKYIRNDSYCEIRRPLFSFNNYSNEGKKNYLEPVVNFNELSQGDSIIAYNVGTLDSRNADARLDDSTKYKVKDIKKFESQITNTTGNYCSFCISYANNNNEIKDGFLYLLNSDNRKAISKSFTEWLDKNKETEKDYYVSKNEGIYNGETLIVEIPFVFNSSEIQIKYISEIINGESEYLKEEGTIICETSITSIDKQDVNNKTLFTWIVNDKQEEGFIDAKWLVKVEDHLETKRYPETETEKKQDKYLEENYDKKSPLIYIYDNEKRSKRLITYTVTQLSEFTVNYDDFKEYITNFNKNGLKVFFLKDGKQKSGFIYIDKLLDIDNDKVKEIIKDIDNDFYVQNFSKNIFDVINIKINLNEEIKINSICCPKDNIIGKNQQLGYVGYSLKKKNKNEKTGEETLVFEEKERNIHFELFTEKSDWDNFSKYQERTPYTAVIKTNQEYLFMKGKLITDFINRPQEIAIKNQELDMARIYNAKEISKDCIISKNIWLRKIKRACVVEGQNYYQMEYMGHFSVNSGNYFVLEDDFKKCKSLNKSIDLYDTFFNKISGKTELLTNMIDYETTRICHPTLKKNFLHIKKFYHLSYVPKVIFYLHESVFNQLQQIQYNIFIVPDDVNIYKKDLYYGDLNPKWEDNESMEKDTYLIKCQETVKDLKNNISYRRFKKTGSDKHYWINEKVYKNEIGALPIEEINYDKWTSFFSELKIDKKKYPYGFGFDSEGLKENLELIGLDYEEYKNSNSSISEYINKNEKNIKFLYFENETEWQKDDSQINYLKEITEPEEKIDILTQKYSFWKECSELNNFPKSSKFLYFYPFAFLSHLDTVACIHAKELYEIQNKVIHLNIMRPHNSKLGGFWAKQSGTFCNQATYLIIRALDNEYLNYTGGKDSVPDSSSYLNKGNIHIKEYDNGLWPSNVWCDVLEYQAQHSSETGIFEVNKEKARTLADMGYVVIISWKNTKYPDKYGICHPHFATVAPSQYFKKINYCVANIGASCQFCELSTAFGHLDEIKFYYNSKQNFKKDANITTNYCKSIQELINIYGLWENIGDVWYEYV